MISAISEIVKLSAAIARAQARAHRNELKNECRRLIKLDRIRGINIRWKKIEFDIAMMALAGIIGKYRRRNDKQDLYKDVNIFTEFCEKYDLLDVKNNSGVDGVKCIILRSLFNDLLKKTNLIEYAKEHENNE